MKFDDDSQRKQDIINYDIDSHVKNLTKELQYWCANIAEKPYAEWDGDCRK